MFDRFVYLNGIGDIFFNDDATYRVLSVEQSSTKTNSMTRSLGKIDSICSAKYSAPCSMAITLDTDFTHSYSLNFG